MKVRLLAIILLAAGFYTGAKAQTTSGMLPVVTATNGDIPVSQLRAVVVVSKRAFANATEEYKFNRLKHNITVVYPYAIQAATLYNEMNAAMEEKDGRREKKKYIKEKQKQLQEQFEEPLKNLTTTQGDLLVKLISRYTGRTCYDLIKDFKNPLSAFFWNSAGKIYGYDLKETYDAQEMRDIEMIVRSLENDYVSVPN